MKYRCLTEEELETLEQDFVHFLAFNTITAPDWVELKRKDPDKAFKLIEDFSDLVFEKVLHNVKYIEKRSKKELRIYECGKEKMQVYGLQASNDSKVDFTDQESINAIATHGLNGDKVDIFMAEKEYTSKREDELFLMLENGAVITDSKLYNVLQSIKNKTDLPEVEIDEKQ